jgi:hypothetical protein
MVNRLHNRFKYALEVGIVGLINGVYNFLKDNKITLTWSVRDELKTQSSINLLNIILLLIKSDILK